MCNERAPDGNRQFANTYSLNTSPPSLTDRSLTRRELLIRFGGTALGAAALSMTSLPRSIADAAAPMAPVADFDAGIVTGWFRLALDLVQSTPGFSPPVASRAFGYLGVALYEALVPGIPGARSLAGQLNGLASLPPPHDHVYYWPAVANAVLAHTIRTLFPTAPAVGQAVITALEAELSNSYTRAIPPGIVKRSQRRGERVATHIFEWSKTDGGHEGYLRNFPPDYVLPSGPGLWVVTPPGFQSALQPDWGSNRPFVLASGAEHDPGPPPPFSTDPGSAFHAEALEVYETVNALTNEQRAIARFWADDPGQTATPPGHSISILTQAIEERGANMATAAEAYAKAGIAVSDAFVSCWRCKFRYNLIRPISYIQQEIDMNWGVGVRALPVTTPPFPEYTSGHSVQIGAFAQVLFDLFGDFTFTDHTHDGRGLPSRTFSSCLEIAEEAAISRLYGGIHFRSAIERGLAQGTAIGHRVSAIKFRLV